MCYVVGGELFEVCVCVVVVLLFMLCGMFFLYMGEELGLEDAIVPSECEVDLGGCDGCCVPILWDGSVTHGWGVDFWLFFLFDGEMCNVLV